MKLAVVLALLGLLAPSFAEQEGTRKLQQIACSLDSHCGQSYYCGQSSCLPVLVPNSPCDRHTQCGTGYCDFPSSCVPDPTGIYPVGCGRCLPPPPPKVPDWGACTSNSDCGSGYCELGQCAARCNTTVINCGPGRVCTNVNNFGLLCLLSKGLAKPGAFCKTSAECQTRLCSRGVCAFRCNVFRWGGLSSGCPAPFYCGADKYCYPPLVPLYGYCNANSVCGSNYCGSCGALPCCQRYNVTVPTPVPSYNPAPGLIPVPVAPAPIILCGSNFPAYQPCSQDCECDRGLYCWNGQCRPQGGCGANLPDLARCTADCECAAGMCFQGFCKYVQYNCGAKFPLQTTCWHDCECECGSCYNNACGFNPIVGPPGTFTPIPGPVTTGTIYPTVKPILRCGAQYRAGETCNDGCECASRNCYKNICQGPDPVTTPVSTYPRKCDANYPLGYDGCGDHCECVSNFCYLGKCAQLPLSK